jgi:hypothetical protein
LLQFLPGITLGQHYRLTATLCFDFLSIFAFNPYNRSADCLAPTFALPQTCAATQNYTMASTARPIQYTLPPREDFNKLSDEQKTRISEAVGP